MDIQELYKIYLGCSCRVTTDSRAISGGELFFALRGENFDGNNYALAALRGGAAFAVVNDDASALTEAGELAGRLIPVPDPFLALQHLAIHHRNTVREGKLPVIGLTGTNGKTTTKELIAAVLSAKYRVTATQGNLNNDIGVPLSLLRITPETEMAVIEMGANHPDDIAKLVRVSQPDYGLITNVGKAHLLGFGSFEGVKAAKGELYRWLGGREGSVIFLNMDSPDLVEMARPVPSHVFGYGVRYQGAEILPSTAGNPFLRIRLDGETVSTKLVGAYNATNVLAAIAVGDYFGVPRRDAIAAVEGYVPANSRSQMMDTGRNTVIADAYNANPSSMAVALDNLAVMQAPRKLALLGGMRELGDDSLREHKAVVDRLSELGIDAFLVGEEFASALREYGTPSCVLGCFPDSDALAAHLAAHPVHGFTILLKGSRGIKMEKVLPAI